MEIKELNDKSVYYMRRTGEYGIENYLLMEQMKQWCAKHMSTMDNAVLYGIAQDNPSVTPSAECRYDVCLEADNQVTGDANLPTQTISGGKYAIYEIPHTSEAVYAVYNEILRQPDIVLDFSRPIIERYDKQKINIGLCEILVPVK